VENQPDVVQFKSKCRIDVACFEQLYHAHWRELFDYCHYYTKDAHLAEEMVQDIFLSVWNRRESIGDIDHQFKRYLIRAAKLKIFDFHRHCARLKEKENTIIAQQETYCHTTEETIYFNELQKNVALLVADLHPKSREVYHLTFDQGLNKAEIAEALDITEKTVEYHLYKVLTYLRKRLSFYRF